MRWCKDADIAAVAAGPYDDDDDDEMMEPDAEQILRQIVDDEDGRRGGTYNNDTDKCMSGAQTSLSISSIFFPPLEGAFQKVGPSFSTASPARSPKSERTELLHSENFAPCVNHRRTCAATNSDTGQGEDPHSHSQCVAPVKSMDGHSSYRTPTLAMEVHDYARTCVDSAICATNVLTTANRVADMCSVPPSPDVYSQTFIADWSNRILGNSNAFTSATFRPEFIQGKVYEIAIDQHGCRFLQQMLDNSCSVDTLTLITSEIIPHMEKLMTDQYANFLIQKLFDVMPTEMRHRVIYGAMPCLERVALTAHGTFSVQKIIETAQSPIEMRLIAEALSKNILHLIMNCHGSHVIQKILQHFDELYRLFIYEAVRIYCVLIAKDKQGCCVLQRCVEYASPPYRARLVDYVLLSCLDIVQDPYGNYVLQNIIDDKNVRVNDIVAIAFLPHLVRLCMNKFSSNVVEKVLRCASPHVQQMYVETMCNPNIAASLMQDKYGNYVLQTALTISPLIQPNSLIAVVRKVMPHIRNVLYVKKVELKLNDVTRRPSVCGNASTPSPDDAYAREGV